MECGASYDVEIEKYGEVLQFMNHHLPNEPALNDKPKESVVRSFEGRPRGLLQRDKRQEVGHET